MARSKYGADKSGEQLLYRRIVADREAINRESRSVPIVLATDAPVPTYDFQRADVVNEVMRIDGVEMPKQIPLLDSHERESVRSVLGSIRDLRKDFVDGLNRIVGTAYFAADPVSVRAFEMYADGHLEDFSVGARRLESRYEGKTKTVLRSRLFEGSAVVAGADPNAKVRELPALRAYLDPHAMKEEIMTEDLKTLCVARGMPADLEGADVTAWAKENLERKAAPVAPAVAPPVAPPVVPGENPDDVARANKKAAADVLARAEDIGDLCRSNGIDEKQRKEWVTSELSVDAIAREILKRKNAGGVPVGPGERISGGASHKEKFVAALSDALVIRSVQGQGIKPHAALERAKQNSDPDMIQRNEALVRTFEKPAVGYDEMRYVSLSDAARMYIEEAGVRTVGLSKQEIVKRAMRTDLLTRDDPGYNTTGSFPNILLDASNKTLLAAFDEAPSTYQIWCRQAPSTPDFKNINRIRFGELADPEVVGENGKYKEKQTSDAKESYTVDKYGEIFSISWEAVVNDDMNAISRIPAMQGTAMRRKINKVVYSVLTANAALADGITLFHASSHGENLDATALAAIAQLSVGYLVMARQTGLTSGTVLGIRPRYLIVPETLLPVAWSLTSSMADPGAGGSAVGNSGNANMYGPNGPRRLTVVSEGQLDSFSTTAWWMAADPSQIDTVELTFLQGEESPVLSREEGFDVDAIRYKIRQTFAAKAIDFRGLYQGNA